MSQLDKNTQIDVLKKHQDILTAATSDNTRRAYRSSIRHFLEFGGLLPADEKTIINYLLAFADTLSVRTLSLRLTAISKWHQHQSFFDPASTPTVRKTLLGIERLHGKPKKQARALTFQDLETMIAYLKEQPTLKAKRDSALLQLAYLGAFRRSEVMGLTVENIQFVSEGIVILLPRSKTDQRGQGITKAIPLGHGICCPSTALKTWLEAAEITTGYLFRNISKGDKLNNDVLHVSSLNQIVVSVAKAASINIEHLSSHSLRRGLATSAYRAGAMLKEIKRQGGWRYDGTVQNYIEAADQFIENAALPLLQPQPKV